MGARRDAKRDGALVSATHAVLFEESKPPRLRANECDACGDPLVDDGWSDDDDGFAIPGSGVYVWSRGEEVRREAAPLCATCAAAIGMSALARWEIEEEEG